ncbi:MAG: DUF4199 domain-containing protein [Cyclobacteriaceae bacterium]
MKKTVLKYGLYATVVMVVLPMIGWLSTSSETDYSFGEVIGYTIMFLAMIFVFLGIRDYRNRVKGGQLKFIEAFKLGLMIAVIPAFAFAVIDQVYVNFINPDFYEEYYAHSLDQMSAEMSGEELEQAVAEMEQQKEMFSNPVFQFLIMFVTVFLVGFIVTVISGLVLKRNEGSIGLVDTTG